MKRIVMICFAAGGWCLYQSCMQATDKAVMVHKAGVAEYVCIPCGYDCDTMAVQQPGTCEDCKMPLVKKSTIVHNSILPAALYAHIVQTGANNILLLDVRTQAEFNGTAPDKFGKLQHAINIPVQQLQQRIKELEAYKNREIIVYCSHSHRSPQASYLLTQSGFSKVTNLLHGMHMWKQEVTDTASNENLYIAQ